MARKHREKRPTTKRPVESYEHRDKERINNPPVGLVTPETDPDAGQKKKYAYDPHLDPQLVWAGKAEHTSFEVPTVSLHVHERIDPRTIIEAVRKRNGNASEQLSLFEAERKEPLRQAIEFYQHKHGWTNRLIAGDSLLVMNSLLEKEGLAGKVQMIYIDPPYGIKYGSNFQPFVNKRDVKDGKDEDLTTEPEQIHAFRDTWELGIHSYLTYLRDRLLLARELLTESGSIFVQISDENLHHVRELMDEVFKPANFVSLISVRKTTSQGTATLLGATTDFILWYARDRNRTKYRQLFVSRSDVADDRYDQALLSDGSVVPSSALKESQIRTGVKLFRIDNLTSSRPAGEGDVREFQFGGRKYTPAKGTFKTNREGLERLANAERLQATTGGGLAYRRFKDDFPLAAIGNLWHDISGAVQSRSDPKVYVVQSSTEIVERCLLMTTDPGDLVFDPTCGSGTTAYVAEQWGRRWITCDTSRVAITLARQRLMTAIFDYYELAHPEEGVGSGFKYKTVPHVTLKSIANNPDIDGICARMHPAIERALSDLNAVLRGHDIPFGVRTGGRSGRRVDFRAPDSAMVKLPSGEEVPANALLDWEVPFEFPHDWPDRARIPFNAFHAARRAMQQAMDAAIARHADQETLYDQPFVDRKKVRVTGPFTVEAVPAPAVKSVEELLEGSPQPADTSIARFGETLRQAEWRDELLRTGIRGKNGQYIRFSRLEPLPGCRWLHADGETRPSAEGADSVREEGTSYAGKPAYESLRVVVSFGPEHGSLEQRQVERAWEEARTLVPRPKLLVFAAFQFDPEAAKDIDEFKSELAGMQLLKVQMNADLLTDDLKKKRASNESFWLIGQPDVQVERIEDAPDKGKYRVSVHGFDYYNTKTGQIESGGADKIAVWLLDTDYDGRSLYPRQVFFPMAGENEGWAKLARNLKAEIDEELIEAYRGTVSLPFEPGEHRRVAVKIVDDRGIESLKVLEVD
ncbi:MAG: site-specific DNA-methyltransferase [Bacillota bacterium]|nr:site-specific DNA-methyltransferase [Bacillota bacterium]